MHAVRLGGKARQPNLFHGEAQDGRKPCGEALEQKIKNGARGAAPYAAGRIAIKRVFPNVEIEGRQIRRAELGERVEDVGEVESTVAFAHELIELGQPVQHIALELRHLGGGQPLAVLEVGKIGEGEAQAVAQLAIDIDGGLHDGRAEADIVGIVGGGDPEP
jgi:hypothetical protein